MGLKKESVRDSEVPAGQTSMLSWIGELWHTDGILEQVAAPGLEPRSLPVAAGPRALFQGEDATHGVELWTVDAVDQAVRPPAQRI